MSSATLLLPARARLAGRALPREAALALGRADRQQHAPGAKAQLRRHFTLVPDHWPVAALTRQLDAGDAGDAQWLRADPAHVAPDLHGARLLAHGSALALEKGDVEALLPALKPLFGDAGFVLDAPQPSRWYLRLPHDAPCPAFDEPDDALGDDLFAHLPEGEPGRRWRALMTEAQVLLHQHPWNRVRAAQGKPAINSLWFWGGGRWPHSVASLHRQVKSPDALVLALAAAAGVAGDPSPQSPVDTLVDLRHLRSPDTFAGDALRPLLVALARRELATLVLDFEDGVCFTLRRGQRWRFWRRPLSGLAE